MKFAVLSFRIYHLNSLAHAYEIVEIKQFGK